MRRLVPRAWPTDTEDLAAGEATARRPVELPEGRTVTSGHLRGVMPATKVAVAGETVAAYGTTATAPVPSTAVPALLQVQVPPRVRRASGREGRTEVPPMA